MSEDRGIDGARGTDSEREVASRIFDNLEGILGEAEEKDAPVADTEPEGTGEDHDEADDDFDSAAADALRGEDSDEEPEEEETLPEDEADEGEPEEEDEPSEDGEEPDIFTVRVDGEEMEVSLDELLAGYSRTESWTRKSQALSQERKAFEATAQEVQAKREEYGSKLHALQQHFEQSLPKEPAADAPDAEWVAYQRQKTQLDQIKAEQERVAAEWRAEHDRTMEKVVEVETEQLLEKVPEWQDDVVRADGLRSLFKFATGVMGFDEETVRDVRDHRLILLLKLAAEAHEMKDAKDTVRSKTKKAKTLKPGSRPSQKSKVRAKKKLARTKGREALRESGDRRDAARALESSGLLDDLI